MDFPHLVHAVIGRLLRAPALHYAVIGGIMFAVLAWPVPPSEPVRLVVPASRIEAAFLDYQALNDRPLTLDERHTVVQYVVDQEILYAYAQRLGLSKEPVVERRLALIGGFVAENPHEAKSTEERANEAVLLGLGDDDMVVRRILIDGARRLIRGAVLVREPAETALVAYLRDHPNEFRRSDQIRLSHVTVDVLRHHERTEQIAHELLARLRKSAVSPETAGRYGDRGFVEPNLPALNEQELERRLGHRFVEQLATLPTGSWAGPVPSRYGQHLVFVEERLPGRVPGLAEIRNEVRAHLRENLADEWLAVRLQQLRAEFVVKIGTGEGN